MIQGSCKGQAFLTQKTGSAAPDDLQVAAGLLETLARRKDCYAGTGV